LLGLVVSINNSDVNLGLFGEQSKWEPTNLLGWIGLVLLWGFGLGAVTSFVAGVACLVVAFTIWAATLVGWIDPVPPTAVGPSGIDGGDDIEVQ
jgi:hypothetical protein